METFHFILTSRIGERGWYNKFREQSYLLNQSSSTILLIGDANVGRYPKIWKKHFSSKNNFGIPGDKIQDDYGEYKI